MLHKATHCMQHISLDTKLQEIPARHKALVSPWVALHIYSFFHRPFFLTLIKDDGQDLQCQWVEGRKDDAPSSFTVAFPDGRSWVQSSLGTRILSCTDGVRLSLSFVGQHSPHLLLCRVWR